MKFRLITGAALTALSLATSLFSTTAAAAQTLTMSNWVPQTHFLFTDVLKPWADEVEKVTEGRVNVKILPKALGAPPQHWELARKGIADITWGNFTYEPDRFKSIWFAEFPYSGTNAKAQSVALWRAFDKHLNADPAYSGIKLLSVGMFGGGQMHHGSKDIANPEDVAGQKFRMGGPIQQTLIENLGGVPVSAPATKAYEMLESKVIDGSLHTLESIVNFRLQDVLTHHTMVKDGLYDATFFLVMNERKWNKLSEADQQAIAGISGEAFAAKWGSAFDQQNRDAEATLKAAGHQFTDASQAQLDKVTAIREQMISDWKVAAKEKGIADPDALLADFASDYAALVTE